MFKTIILGIVSVIAALMIFILFCILISIVQESLFSPREYIMRLFKSPAKRLIFFYLHLFVFISLYISIKSFRKNIYSKYDVIKIHKRSLLFAFVMLNILLLYTLLFNVTVITKETIIDYRFFSPQGKTYHYNDITKIDTGVYGKEIYFPSEHSNGDFYYIIEFKDGIKIDLTEFAGTSSQEDPPFDDPRFIIEKLDKKFVNMGINKVSSMDNFQYCTENLGKIYTDKIKSILENVKR